MKECHNLINSLYNNLKTIENLDYLLRDKYKLLYKIVENDLYDYLKNIFYTDLMNAYINYYDRN